MRSRLWLPFVFLVIVSAAVLPAVAGQTKAPAAAGGDLAVTVNYTGKGPVDAAHEILVFLFSSPNIDASAQPIGMQPATKNGSTVTFKPNVSPVYVVAVYNETGAYHGRGGPPPAGLPYSIYSKDAKSPPTAVTPGAKAAVKMSFSDARRWGK